MKAHWSRTALIMVITGMVAAMTPAVAPAQSRADLVDKVEALEKQIQALQRRVFPNRSEYFEDEAPADQDGGAAPAGRGNRALVADLSVRIAELESQIRDLTGKLEELEFRQRRHGEQFERFKADVEFRLSAIENGGASATGDGAGGQAAADAGQAPSGLIRTPTPDDADAVREQRAAESAAAESAAAESAAAVAPAESADEQSAESMALPEGSPQEQYDYALSQLRRGRFDQAEAAFTAFLERYPDRELAGNAQYWLGESYYVRRDYPRAAKAFLDGYQQYGDSPKGADSLLKLGMTLAALDQPSEACAAFDELEARYAEADDRLMRLMAAERARLDCGS